ncbi:MAG: polyprenyl synthetase family protein [Planctomycetota bacterium]|nr:MAG: polyprenyl synthetase family protein [Planctomycetota bacterium]
MDTPDFSTVVAQRRQRIEDALRGELPPAGDCPSRLAESMWYSLAAGGKRVRPVLTLLACEACGGSIEAALPAAVAIEMIHTYSLIHDDLPAMDDDDLRRGMPTNHIQFGEATAILAGDGLLTRAFEIISRDVKPAAVAVACCVELASAAGAEGMVGGQQADLEAETTPVRTVEALEAIHRRKTGRLLSAALLMGGRIAQTSPQNLRSLQIYGESIGLAFQIADDLLDVVGDAGKMGKGVRKDSDLNKLTYPSLLGLDESRRRANSLVDCACEAVSGLGPQAAHLQALARYIIERDH